MSESWPEVLKQWRDRALSKVVRVSSSQLRDANANMLVWPVADAIGEGVSVGQMGAFLRDVRDHYALAVGASKGPVMFYVWFDAMSDTLRCSLCAAEVPGGRLPFECRVKVIPAVETVLAEALGLSGSEFVLAPGESGEDESCGEFVQVVYVERISGTGID